MLHNVLKGGAERQEIESKLNRNEERTATPTPYKDQQPLKHERYEAE